MIKWMERENQYDRVDGREHQEDGMRALSHPSTLNTLIDSGLLKLFNTHNMKGKVMLL